MILDKKADMALEGQTEMILGGLKDLLSQKMPSPGSVSQPSGRAGYWKYFERRGMKADCLIGVCKHPSVPLGRVGSRRGTFSLTEHLRRNHAETWAKYLRQKKTSDVTLAFGDNTTI